MNMLLFIPSVRDSGLYLESYDLALAFTTYHLKFHRKLLRSYLLHAFYFNLLILTSPHLTSPHLTSPHYHHLAILSGVGRSCETKICQKNLYTVTGSSRKKAAVNDPHEDQSTQPGQGGLR